MIVVDTNIICYSWMASVAHNAAAAAAWTKDSEWIAPLLWRSDFRNALAGTLRAGIISPADALDIATKAEAHFERREFLVSTESILDLVAQSNCSAYDCEFVALAQEHRVPLVTVDRQVLREFPRIAVSLEEFARA